MSTLKLSSIENLAGTKYMDGMEFIRGTARSFCYVTMSGTTPTIQRECNVQSITYIGTGVFQVNFKTHFKDQSYGMTGCSGVNQANTAQITEPFMELEQARAFKSSASCRFNIIKQVDGLVANPDKFAIYFIGD